MRKMKLNTLQRGICLICLVAVGVSALTGCSGTSERAGVTDAVKDVPDMDHLKTKPGENKTQAFKRAFRQSAPGVGE